MIKNPYDKEYKGPFHSDDYSFVWTAYGDMAFDWQDGLTLPPSHKNLIVDFLNGQNPQVSGFKGKFVIGTDPRDRKYELSDKADAKYCTIWYVTPHLPSPPVPIMRVRGWGHLTGCGGLQLSEKEAAIIQDGFLEWAVSRLNEKDYPEAGLEEIDLVFNRDIAQLEYEDIERVRHQKLEEEIAQRSKQFQDFEPYGTVVNDPLWHKEYRAPQNKQPWYNRYNHHKKRKKR